MSEEEVPPTDPAPPPLEEGGGDPPAGEEAPVHAVNPMVEELRRNKPKVFVHWSRPKSHLYDYNYNYGQYYYKSMIDYLNNRSYGYRPEAPKPQTWAERALRSYLDTTRSPHYLQNDYELLSRIRNSCHQYQYHTYRKHNTGLIY